MEFSVAHPVALVVRFTVRAGSEAAFDDLVAATAAGIRASEPGTLVYACHRVEGAPRERIFYELYCSQGGHSKCTKRDRISAISWPRVSRS